MNEAAGRKKGHEIQADLQVDQQTQLVHTVFISESWKSYALAVITVSNLMAWS